LSISLRTKQRQLLYSTDESDALQNLLWWLDDRHFTVYEGSLLGADQAQNLRLVDIKTGTNRILFDGDFVAATLDPAHQVFALYAIDSEKYPQGIYLVSIQNQAIRFLEGAEQLRDFPEWGEGTGLFVSEDPCPNDSSSLRAFDYQGNFSCVYLPALTLEAAGGIPSPDGKWMLSVNDGLWLETRGQAATRVSPNTAAHVTWCPDSSCFFFSVLQPDYTQTLYRVSMPELEIKMVDEGIASNSKYQWLGNP
jgi:hypothetical protein